MLLEATSWHPLGGPGGLSLHARLRICISLTYGEQGLPLRAMLLVSELPM